MFILKTLYYIVILIIARNNNYWSITTFDWFSVNIYLTAKLPEKVVMSQLSVLLCEVPPQKNSITQSIA